jgi:hypothetical protein
MEAVIFLLLLLPFDLPCRTQGQGQSVEGDRGMKNVFGVIIILDLSLGAVAVEPPRAHRRIRCESDAS